MRAQVTPFRSTIRLTSTTNNHQQPKPKLTVEPITEPKPKVNSSYQNFKDRWSNRFNRLSSNTKMVLTGGAVVLGIGVLSHLYIIVTSVLAVINIILKLLGTFGTLLIQIVKLVIGIIKTIFRPFF
jgi:hypothetical protein